MPPRSSSLDSSSVLLGTTLFLIFAVAIGAGAALPMFEAVPASPALNSVSAGDPAVKRSRFVRLTSAVNQIEEPVDLVAQSLQVNLFHDREFTLNVERWKQTAFGGHAFRGPIGDNPWSSGLFVHQNGVVAGVVNVPGAGVFRIQHVGAGVHKIVELDPANMAQCGVDLLPDGIAPVTGRGETSAEDVSANQTVAGELPLNSTRGPVVQGDPATVDIMIVYTDLSMEGAGGRDGIETLAQLAVEESNFCFENSQVDLQLNIVNIRKVDYEETGSIQTDLQNLQGGRIDGLEDLRFIQYKADLVSMITEREDSGTIAGIAYVMVDPGNPNNRNIPAYSVVRRAYAVGNYTFPHEIGHNLGCAHDRDNSSPPPNNGAFDYSYGERFVAQNVTYATVMTYPPGVRIPYFSNPNISYQGTPTGVSSNSPLGTDNAATINYTAGNVTSDYLIAARRYAFSATQFSGDEGGQVEITVNRIGSAASGMSIEYSTSDDTALGGSDFEPKTGILSFGTGETQKSFTINLLEDGDAEPAETLFVHLSNPRPIGNSALGVPESAAVTIVDDESSFFAFVPEMSVFENAGQAGVVVVRGGETNTTATIDYSLTSGTADEGTDYVVDSGRLIFGPGENMKSVWISIEDDFEPEPEESFTFSLSNPSGGYALIEPRQVVIDILDDDRPGALVPYADASGGLNDVVYAVNVRPNGKILVAGTFSQISGKLQAGLAQLNTDGTFDPGFDPGVGIDGTILAMDLLPDGRVVIAGDFGSVNGIARNSLALLLPDGELDEAFDPGASADSWIRSVAVDAEDRILIGGFFSLYRDVPRNFIARVNGDGTLDDSFDPGLGPNAVVRSIAVDTNGKIVIGGDFTSLNGQAKRYYGRLLANGGVDPTFQSIFGADNLVRAVSIQNDGKILLGGHFGSVDGNQASRVARLNANGSYDGSFSTVIGPNDNVHGLVKIPADGGVIIGGDFSAIGAAGRNRIAKLFSNGTLDTNFDPGTGANALVWSVDTDSAGRVHLGGEFSKVNGQERLRIATLRVTPNQGVFEPVISPLAASDLQGGEVRLNFTSRPGTQYALDYAHELSGDWSPVVTNIAASDTMELVDTNPAPDRRYYRIREVN